MDESIKAMTQEEQDALSMFSDFVLTTSVLDKAVDEYLPHYGLFHKEGKHQTAFCTHCRQEFKLYSGSDWYTVRTAATGKAKHGERDQCALCGYMITYLADGRGRRGINDYQNFIVFEAVSETQLLAKCIRVSQRFANPDSGKYFADVSSEIFDYSYYEVARYYFEVGKKPLKFIRKSVFTGFEWQEGWKKCSRFSEPVFVMSPYGGGDNSYIILGEEEIYSTQFGYMVQEAAQYISSAHRYTTLSNMLITLLGSYCTKPQLEYILKAGFPDIVESVLSHQLCGLRLNWKSNDLKKVLGMNKAEIKALKGWSTMQIVNYRELRKIDKRAELDDIVALLSKIAPSGNYMYYFVRDELIRDRGETCRSVRRYLDKCKASLRDWKDYLDQCRQLEYDLYDPAIYKPRDLLAVHERLTTIIKVRAAEELEQKIAELSDERRMYRYYDSDYDIFIREPVSVQEIIDEGKALMHCVAGYSDRHVRGDLTILFIRKAEDPLSPFYTMEVSNLGKIVQCRGYHNNREIPKPKYISDFERKYQNYLNEIYPVIEAKRKEAEKKKKKIQKKARKSA